MSELHAHAGGWHVHRGMTDPDHGGLGPPSAIHKETRMSNNARLVLSFESGHIQAEKGAGLAGEWEFSFFTDTEGSYMSCDVSEATLRSLLAFIDATGEVAR